MPKNEIEEGKIIIKINLIKISYITLLAYICLLFFAKLIIECKQRRILSKDSTIRLKVKGSGNNIQILSSNYNNLPNEIYINKIKQDEISTKYNFTESENNVILIYNYEINSTKSMFSGCNNILEIDLSDFDTSKVTDMSSMFSNCHSLSSLNLSNFETTQVETMANMFYACSKLTSLDLSNFDTSKVTTISNMFYSCTKLTSLDLFNFDGSNIDGSFFYIYNRYLY